MRMVLFAAVGGNPHRTGAAFSIREILFAADLAFSFGILVCGGGTLCFTADFAGFRRGASGTFPFVFRGTAFRFTANNASGGRCTGGFLPIMVDDGSFGLTAVFTGGSGDAGGRFPVVAHGFSVGLTAAVTGYRGGTGGLFPGVSCGLTVCRSADAAGSRFGAGGVLPAMPKRFSLCLAAGRAGFGRYAGGIPEGVFMDGCGFSLRLFGLHRQRLIRGRTAVVAACCFGQFAHAAGEGQAKQQYHRNQTQKC